MGEDLDGVTFLDEDSAGGEAMDSGAPESASAPEAPCEADDVSNAVLMGEITSERQVIGKWGFGRASRGALRCFRARARARRAGEKRNASAAP